MVISMTVINMSEQNSCLGENSVAFNAFLKALAVLSEGDLSILPVQECPKLECHAVPQICMDIFSLILKLLLLPVKEAGVTKFGQWPCTFPLNHSNE